MSSKAITIKGLIDLLKSNQVYAGRPYIIAVIGGSASGKTTIAAVLERSLDKKAVIFSQDLFQLGKDFEQKDTSIYKWDDPKNFALDDCARALRIVRSGSVVEVPAFDVVANQRVGTYMIEPRPYVIWEGIYAAASDDLRKLVDFSVYVDTPFSVRLLRRIKRFIETHDHSIDPILYAVPAKQMLTFVSRAEKDFAAKQATFSDYVITYDTSLIEADIDSFIQTAEKIPHEARLTQRGTLIATQPWQKLTYNLYENGFEVVLDESIIYFAPLTTDVVAKAVETFDYIAK